MATPSGARAPLAAPRRLWTATPGGEDTRRDGRVPPRRTDRGAARAAVGRRRRRVAVVVRRAGSGGEPRPDRVRGPRVPDQPSVPGCSGPAMLPVARSAPRRPGGGGGRVADRPGAGRAAPGREGRGPRRRGTRRRVLRERAGG